MAELPKQGQPVLITDYTLEEYGWEGEWVGRVKQGQVIMHIIQFYNPVSWNKFSRTNFKVLRKKKVARLKNTDRRRRAFYIGEGKLRNEQ